jgi:cyclase
MRHRRAGSVLFALALCMRTAGARAADASSHFTFLPVGPGVFAAIARPGDEASLGNAGVVVGSDSALVVDTFATPEAATELLAEIGRKSTLPVRWIVNTHFHGDHLGGNAVLAKTGAVILGHETVRAWGRGQWRKTATPEEREAWARRRLPDVTYRDGVTIWLGDRKVDVFARPGHTAADSIVSVPDARVVFAGDLFWKNTVPNLVDAKTDTWSATLEDLVKALPSATFVPGHGDPGKALDVRLFRDYLRSVRLAVERALREGKSGAVLREAVRPQLAERYSRWAGFELVDENIAQTEAELRGTKEFPPAPSP